MSFFITAEIFKASTGIEPELDDLDRCNCNQAGKMGHLMCGWCASCHKPVFMCSHVEDAANGRYVPREP